MHFPANDTTLLHSVFMTEKHAPVCECVYMPCFLVAPSVDGQLGCSHNVAAVNSAVYNCIGILPLNSAV